MTEYIIPLGLSVAFLNTGAVSATLFIRPYELQSLSIIFATFVFLKIYRDIEKFNFFSFVLLVFTSAFVFLSGYLTGIYLLILGAVLLIKLLKKRKIKTAIALITIPFLAFLICVLCYPFYFINLFDSQRVYNTLYYILGNDFMPNLINTTRYFFSTYINYLFYPLILVFFAITCFIFKKKNGDDYDNSEDSSKDNSEDNGNNGGNDSNDCNDKEADIIILAALLTSFIMLFAVSIKILRYIMPFMAIASVIIPCILMKFNSKKVTIAFFVLFFLCSIFPLKVESYDSEFQPENRFYIPFGAKIENTFFGFENQYQKLFKISNEKNIPTIIVYDYDWRYWNLIDFFNPDSDYIFFSEQKFDKNKSKIFKIAKQDKSNFYLMVTKSALPMLSGFENNIDYMGKIQFFEAFRIK